MPLRDPRLVAVLQKVAPGTALREGIDRIIRSGKGALIVLGDTDGVEHLVSGGFRLGAKFTAQRLSEVAKMDGAIVLDDTMEHLVYANVHLVPDPGVPTSETGTRHRTADRVARQTGKPVISVSESMRTVSLYVEGQKHQLEEISSVLFRANQTLSTLERYRDRLTEVSRTLDALEIDNFVTLRDVLAVLHRIEMVRRFAEEVEAYIAELGTDGRLLQLQLNELMAGVETERLLVVRDYMPDRRRRVDNVLAELDLLPPERLLDPATLGAALGYAIEGEGVDQPVAPRGYRLLSRIPRLPDVIVQKLVSRFTSLQRLLDATLEELDDVEGIGAARARTIKEGLFRLAEMSPLDRYGTPARPASAV